MREKRRCGKGREGMVLGVTVLTLVALTLLAHGLLLLARQERAASRAGLAVLQARAAAEAATLLPLTEGLPDTLSRVRLLDRVELGQAAVSPHHGHGFLLRLGREAWLAGGEGRADGQSWTWTSGRLLWVLDPVARAAGEPWRVGSSASAPPGSLQAPVFRPSSAPAWCLPWASGLDSLGAGAGGGTAGSVDTGRPASLGRLGLSGLERRLDPGPGADAGTPEPASAGGVCGEGVWNWGDPDAPSGPCGSRGVARAHAGDLLLQGGRGQGLLVVRGDLRMEGTSFVGVLVVGGDLVMAGGARVVGLIRVGGRLEAEAGSAVTGSPCNAVRWLASAWDRLQRPVLVRESGLLEGG